MWNSANKKQRIKLLTEVSGYMPPGHLSALVRLAWFPRMCHEYSRACGLSWHVCKSGVVPYPDHQVQCVAFRWAHPGSSKTTLLDVIAGRKTVGTISGKILFAGQKGTRTFLRRYTGYVEQFR